MSEPIWCNITIHTPATWWPDGVDSGRGDPWFCDDAAEALCNGSVDVQPLPGRMSVIIEGEGNYGLYDSHVEELLDNLEKLRIPYRASANPKYEWDGELRVYDGKDRLAFESNANGSPVVHEALAHELGSYEAVLDYLKGGPGLLDVSLEHLPETLPDRPQPEEGDQ